MLRVGLGGIGLSRGLGVGMGVSVGGGGGGAQLLSAPSGFAWSPPAEFAIYKQGSSYTVGDFDVSQYAPTGTTYYVDVNSGNDTSGSGTEAAPWKSVYKALTQADVDVVYIKPGTYKRSGGGTDGATFTRSVAIRRWPGTVGDIILTSAQAGLSWSVNATYGNVYEATRSACNDVLDVSQTDANGDYQRLTNAGSIANVDTTAGSWYTDGTKVYVRTADDRAPDSDVWPLVTNNLRFTGNITVYIEDVIAVGGVSGAGAIWLQSTGVGQTPKLYLKNCTISHGTGNGVQADGVTEAILQNCTTFANLQDGYNYHAQNSIVPHAIEIGCTSRHNGVADGTGNDNGSSMHDAGSIIRVNGNYHDNIGPNVVDVGTAEAWCLGCTATDSASDASTATGYQIDGEMWLDGCAASGNADGDLVTAAGSTIHTRNTTYTTTAGAGTVDTY